MNPPSDAPTSEGPRHDISTEELVKRAANGDQAAVGELVARHLIRIRAFLRLRCGAALRAKESATDLAQSVCHDVIRNLDGFRWEGQAQFEGWLCLAAFRKVSDRAAYWGTARRDVAREAPNGDGALLDLYRRSASPSQIVSGREEIEKIERAFDELPDDYREVILLSRVVGLSREEVATRMGRTEDSVRNLLFRGLAQLSRKLEARA